MSSDSPPTPAALPHLDLILYGKPDCHLCDRLEALLRPHIERLGSRVTITVTKRDIEMNPQWHDWYRYRIPVLTHNGKSIIEGKPSENDVAAAMDELAAPAGQSHTSLPVYLPARGQPCILMERMHRDARAVASVLPGGPYAALHQTIAQSTPQAVIEQIAGSGLRMRDVGGEPVADVLMRVAHECADTLTACVAVPPVFSAADAQLLSRDPHAVIAGTLVAAYACGAEWARIVLNGVEAQTAAVIRTAVRDADYGAINPNVLTVIETSRETRDGEAPLLTNALNIETLAPLPWILARGPRAYAKYGHARSRGAMLVTVTGAVRRPGLFEVECGRTLRHIVFELAEGLKDGAALAGVRVGANGEPVIGEDRLDLPLDYEALGEAGVTLGPAGVEVLEHCRA